MTPPEHAAHLMREIAKDMGGDPEVAHRAADQLLCTVLQSLGYGEMVKEWDKIEKWYA